MEGESKGCGSNEDEFFARVWLVEIHHMVQKLKVKNLMLDHKKEEGDLLCNYFLQKPSLEA